MQQTNCITIIQFYKPHTPFMVYATASKVLMESQRKQYQRGQISPNNDSQPLQTPCLSHIT